MYVALIGPGERVQGWFPYSRYNSTGAASSRGVIFYGYNWRIWGKTVEATTTLPFEHQTLEMYFVLHWWPENNDSGLQRAFILNNLYWHNVQPVYNINKKGNFPFFLMKNNSQIQAEQLVRQTEWVELPSLFQHDSNLSKWTSPSQTINTCQPQCHSENAAQLLQTLRHSAKTSHCCRLIRCE